MEQFAVIDNYLCIKMPQEVDHHGAAGIRENADRLLLNEKVRNIVFDFEDTTFMDSSGIGIITRRFRQVYARGGSVGVINVNDRIDRILLMSGIYRIAEKLKQRE